MKKTKAPKIVSIAILTTITVFAWIFFEVYRVFTESPNPNVPPEILEPLQPTLDEGVLKNLVRAIFFEEGEVSTPVIVVEEEEELQEETPLIEEEIPKFNLETSTESGGLE